MRIRRLTLVCCLALCSTPLAAPETSAALRARIEASPNLHLQRTLVIPKFADAGLHAGSASWVAVGRNGLLYELQRGGAAAPILVLDEHGTVVRFWGAGDFTLPHSLRIDREGTVWAVDAGSSTVVHYSARGRKLSTIHVGDAPDNGSPFHGTTDIAFLRGGHLLIADGYGNARVLEYTRAGKRIRQWGSAGQATGQFHLPHAIAVDDQDQVYVADRENGRIEEFTSSGRYIRSITGLGRVYAFRIAGNFLWVSSGPPDQAPGSANGWILKLDVKTGALLGHIDLPEERSGHSLDLLPSGEPVITAGDGIMRFKAP